MVCEFYNYQILEMSTRNHKEKVEYLRGLIECLIKRFGEDIKKEVDKIQHDYASLEICRKDEVEKIINKLIAEKTRGAK